MATCKECKNCKVQPGYWVCKAVGRSNPMIALKMEGVEVCEYFEPSNRPFYLQSTLSRYIEKALRA
ncbi:MAG: hypothetical protein R6U44_01165 [Archaeoglobaceae archaeon]